MTGVLRGIVALCAAVTAAHFLRVSTIWDALAVALPGLAVVAPRLVPRPVLAVALLCGTWFWVAQTVDLVSWRVQMGFPWARVAVILGAVSLLHAVGLMLLLGESGRRVYGDGDAHPWVRSLAFGGTGMFLLVAVNATPVSLLLGERFFSGSELFWVGLFSVYAGVVAGRLLVASARTRTWIWSAFSLIFFVQLLLGLSGFRQFLMTGNLHLPVPALILSGPIFRGEGVFMPLLLAVSLLLVGPAWCSHLCYIGAWDDRLSGWGPKRPRPLPPWAPKVRAAILLGALALPLGLRILGASWIWGLSAAMAFGMVGVGVMLLWSRQSGVMVHCTLWCPIGLVNNLVGRLSPWRVRIAPECTACGLCSRACRYNALTPADLQRKKTGMTCSLCGDCLAQCPHGHLAYTFAGRQRWSREVFVVLVTVLHTVFLAVARI